MYCLKFQFRHLLCLAFLIGIVNCKYVMFDPDEARNTTELIRSKGYPCEEHDVVTDDGYILSVQRIPYGINGRGGSNAPRPVVLMQHGLLDASSTWVLNLVNQSLGFFLADAGYDVWLGNVRGNTYGLRHKTLDPKSDAFWDFSWDDMAAHDLPSMINYALKVTNQQQLFYVGHSQGTLIGFAQFGMNKETASKVKLFLALGPVATVAHIESPVKYLSGPSPAVDDLWYSLFGRRNFMENTQTTKWLADKFCDKLFPQKEICENILFLFCGPSKFMNQTRIPVYVAHDPAGTSVKNVLHFSQMVYSKQFQMYNYGTPQANMKHYNQTTAPLYNIKDVTLPTALFWAQNDWLADPDDVQFLRQNLPNIVYDQYVDNWDHLDFIWATDARDVMYKNMLALMQKYQ